MALVEVVILGVTFSSLNGRSGSKPAGYLQIRPDVRFSYFLTSGQSLWLSGLAPSSGEIVAISL
jgi:hypothetical protein